jgi:hypothetical protein
MGPGFRRDSGPRTVSFGAGRLGRLVVNSQCPTKPHLENSAIGTLAQRPLRQREGEALAASPVKRLVDP